MKRIAFISALVFAAAFFAYSQDALVKAAKVPQIDGTVAASEYQITKTVSGMQIGASLGADGLLYLSIQVPTSGWVALGVGGAKMDGSRLFIAYDSAGKQFFTEQIGAGHSHADAKDQVVKKWAVKMVAGTTVLELSLPLSAATASNQVDILFAYSTGLAFVHHSARGTISLTVKN